MDCNAGGAMKTERADLAQILFRELQSATCAFGGDSRLLTQETLKATAFFVARCLDARNPLRTISTMRGTRMPIAAIVHQCHIDVFEFCRQFPTALRLLKPRFKAQFGTEIDAEIEAQMNEWRTSLIHTIFLFKRYREIFLGMFKVQIDQLCDNEIFRFGWLLFIVEKMTLARDQATNSLQSRFYLLLVICNFLYVYTPNSSRFSDQRRGPQMDDGERRSSVFTLHRIAQENRVPSAEWKKLEIAMTSIEEKMIQIFNGAIDIQNHQSPTPSGEETRSKSSERLYRCLDPEKHFIDGFVGTLHNLYSDELSAWGECDERIFLDRDVFMRVGPSTPNTEPDGTAPMSLTVSGSGQSHLSSPAVASVSLGNWLLTFDQLRPLAPSQTLQWFFESCQRDLTTQIQSMLTRTTQKLFPNSTDPQELSHEASLGIKIFYHAMERLIEEERRQETGLHFSSVFIRSTFCQCVLACSLEIIVESFQTEHLFFPSLIQSLQVNAFDLCKIIDLFVQVMWDLPPRLKTHLYQIEERIIESLGWQSDSSIYALIAKTAMETSDSSHATEESATTPFFTSRSIPGLSLDQRSPTSAFKVVSPTRSGKISSRIVISDRLRTTTETTSSVSSIPSVSTEKEIKIPGALGQIELVHSKPTRGRAILEDFFRKHLKLASFRLLDFKTQLDLAPKQSCTIMLQVYKLMKYALYEHTSLFYSRHMDQILLCALYGVSKVNNLSMTFRKLLHCYKNQTHHRPETYRLVIISQSNPGFQVEEVGSIIEFYNKVFVARVEPYLLSLNQTEESETETSSGVKENRQDIDPEPLSCHRIAPWLISDTSHLTSLLKGGRWNSASPNIPGSNGVDRSLNHTPRNAAISCAINESCRSSTSDDEINEPVPKIGEHVSKRIRH